MHDDDEDDEALSASTMEVSYQLGVTCDALFVPFLEFSFFFFGISPSIGHNPIVIGGSSYSQPFFFFFFSFSKIPRIIYFMSNKFDVQTKI